MSFLFSANKNGALQNISSVASGGEIARVMLSVKAMIAGAVKLPTIVFDEIDTGVSGKNAEKIGILLHESAQDCQIICVTHSAQVAAKADYHYRITKKEEDGRTETEVCLLDFDGRVEEISRIMGGIKISETIRQSAREALMNSKKATNTLNIQES